MATREPRTTFVPGATVPVVRSYLRAQQLLDRPLANNGRIVIEHSSARIEFREENGGVRVTSIAEPPEAKTRMSLLFQLFEHDMPRLRE